MTTHEAFADLNRAIEEFKDVLLNTLEDELHLKTVNQWVKDHIDDKVSYPEIEVEEPK